MLLLFTRCLHPATTEATLESHDIRQRTANTVFLSCITRAMAMSGIPKIVRVHHVFPVGWVENEWVRRLTRIF